MFKEVTIGSLLPNPYRRLDEYPIIRDKVEALRESLRATGYWANICARPAGNKYEITFGHHRLIALQEEWGLHKKVSINVEDYSNEQMLKMMARENSQEYGSSAWVEMETLRAVIDAYGKGEIELPAVPEKTNKSQIRYAGQSPVPHEYTTFAVAEFIGWVRKKDDGHRPNHACEVAFKAMDMIDDGFLSQNDLKGLQREHVNQLVISQWSIFQANIRAAEQAIKDANSAKKVAEKTDDPKEKKRLEKKAEVLEEQAEVQTKKAKHDAKEFGKEATTMLRNGASVRDVRQKAEEKKPTVIREKVVDLDGLARKVEDALARIANDDDAISVHMSIIRKNAADVSGDALAALDRSFSALVERLQAMRKGLKVRV